jgi:hypothetical protein
VGEGLGRRVGGWIQGPNQELAGLASGGEVVTISREGEAIDGLAAGFLEDNLGLGFGIDQEDFSGGGGDRQGTVERPGDRGDVVVQGAVRSPL